MKKVLITMRYDINQYGKLIDIFERDYSSLFSNYPIQLIILPNVWDSMEYWINVGFDGLILSGGNDISVNEKGMLSAKEFLSSRDKIELELLKFAKKTSIPVLGICRGMQMINLSYGGVINLFSNENNHALNKSHPIEVLNSKFSRDLGTFMLTVNSFHNWYSYESDIPKEIKIFAKSKNIVEGIISGDCKIVGIQWHPEREEKITPISDYIINLFVKKLW